MQGAFLAWAIATPADEALFRALNLAGSNAVLDAFFVLLTIAGLAYVLALLAIPLWAQGHGPLAVDFLVLLVVTVLVTEVLKFAIDRPRPCDVLPGVATLGSFRCSAELDPAFPSGHASRAFAAAALLGLRRSWRSGAAMGAVAFGIGLSRIYLGVHWPSDVLAGAALGVALAIGMYLVAERSRAYVRARDRVVATVARILRRGRGP